MEKFYTDDIRAIDKKISELMTIRKELGEKQRNAFLEETRHFVGKCYRYVGQNIYFKVIDVPQVQYNLNGGIFNKYQFPVFLIDTSETEDIPFYKDTVYLDIEISIPKKGTLREKCVEEISNEEFTAILQEECNKMFYEVTNGGSK